MKKSFTLLALFFCFTQMNFAQLNMTFRSNLTYPFVLSNIWGYVDTLNNEYALVGTNQGMSVVDVSDPDNPNEVYTVVGPTSNWREIKTKGKYAYVTTEGGSSGLQIVNLSGLPGPISSQFWAPTISGTVLETIHALHVDGNFLYLYGSNIDNGATIIVDVTNPASPVYVNTYIYPGVGNARYVHDGIVMNDTMYEGHIYTGIFTVVDVTDKMNPVLLATQTTPGAFTHNTWLSDDHKTLFTTDEVSNSFLTAYDISDLSNITELDRIQSNPGSNSIVHNTYVLNDYCVTSWYKDGVVVVDGHRPENLVQVGNYDTFVGGGNGFSGDWGVYPYLPSGNLILSDINNGLFVITPTYVRASYLEGMVTDSICGTPLSGVQITILASSASTSTDISGDYKTGLPGSGTYTVQFVKAGYATKVIPNVAMTATLVTNLNVQMYSAAAVGVDGHAAVASSLNDLEGAQVVFTNSSNTYQFNTNLDGDFSTCSMLAGSYEVYVSKWGYKTKCLSGQTVGVGSNTFDFELELGYYDDFITDFSWTVSGVSTNVWERGVPIATMDGPATANPGSDASGDCGNISYVTDNGGGNQWDNDVDGGSTILTSPIFDLTGYINPSLSYSRWFYNGNTLNGPLNDTMTIKLSNGTSTVTLETLLNNSAGNGTWLDKNFIISDFITPSSAMRLILEIGDSDPGNVVEGGFDRFEISADGFESLASMKNASFNINVYPNPFMNSFTIKTESDAINGVIKIIDVSGRSLSKQALSSPGSIQISASNWAMGFYFIQLEDEFGRVLSVKKIVKAER